METPGFEEDKAAYVADPRSLIGQIRRWGSAGPAYEVMSINEDGTAVCEIIYSGEVVTCPVAEVLSDPIAETIP